MRIESKDQFEAFQAQLVEVMKVLASSRPLAQVWSELGRVTT